MAAARDAGFSLNRNGSALLGRAIPDEHRVPAPFPPGGGVGRYASGRNGAAFALHNPVELAESIATLDCITGGRFVFGIGLGYRGEEYTAFGVKREERVGRMNESLEIIKRLWVEDEMEYEGKYYTIPKTKLANRPVQLPHPPIWVAANNDVAIRRAAGGGIRGLSTPTRRYQWSLTNGAVTPTRWITSETRFQPTCP